MINSLIRSTHYVPLYMASSSLLEAVTPCRYRWAQCRRPFARAREQRRDCTSL